MLEMYGSRNVVNESMCVPSLSDIQYCFEFYELNFFLNFELIIIKVGSSEICAS